MKDVFEQVGVSPTRNTLEKTAGPEFRLGALRRGF
jgi:hypothetical protein